MKNLLKRNREEMRDAEGDFQRGRILVEFDGDDGLPGDVNAFEFQMLYGVRRDLQRRLAREGFGVRVYIPFGTAWYPYFMRRLSERPANVVFLARNLLRN